MDMILSEIFFRVYTIISNLVISPLFLRQAVIEFSYHHHISAFDSSAFGSSEFDSFSSSSLGDSISNLDSSSLAGDTEVTGPIPSLDLSVGITVTF